MPNDDEAVGRVLSRREVVQLIGERFHRCSLVAAHSGATARYCDASMTRRRPVLLAYPRIRRSAVTRGT